MRIALIDDDAAVLDSLQLYLKHKGVSVAAFPSADAFLAAADTLDAVDCVVADVRMPGLSGLDLVRRIGSTMPIILITGHGDVEMAVSAIKLGAFDFIEKPFDETRLLDRIASAAGHGRQKQQEVAGLSDLRTRLESLTERQREVMELAAIGLSNKEIGTRLGISARTVEIHRAWMMERMGAANLAELVRMEMRLKSPIAPKES